MSRPGCRALRRAALPEGLRSACPRLWPFPGFNGMLRPMRKRRLTWAVCFGLALGWIGKADDASVARGKYLVDEVARCSMCHTPHDDSGKPDMAQYLKGGPLSIQPVQAAERWHKATPDITSTSRIWQRWGDDAFVKFLETATAPSGRGVGAPMPSYKLSHEDAQAIKDYLKSLK